MTPNPILKVLSTFQKHKVKCLLIGGQACIIYGAAEFSRDSDFVILCTSKNLELLQKALNSLKAGLIYLPLLEMDYLERGHACHFRCNAKEVEGLRVDVISKLRGCDPFDKLWERKKTIRLENGNKIDIIGLHDLVQSKKTQRDKDWLMLAQLIENDIILNKNNPSRDRVALWLCESRKAKGLIELVEKYPKIAAECAAKRSLLSYAVNKGMQKLELELHQEELTERQKDIDYWAPLKKEFVLVK